MFDGTCEVRRALIHPDGRAQVDIKATNGAFDWRWAWSAPDTGRQILAVCLTAIATNKLVYCTISNPQADPLPLDGGFGIAK